MTPAQRIDTYLRKKGSPLAGLGNRFVQAGRRNGIDPLLLVAISGAESSFATTRLSGPNNPFGWGPGKSFGSFGEAIDTIARGLRVGYANEGRKTIKSIGAKWAPVGAGNDPTNLNSNWIGNVTTFYRELGGSGVVPRGGSPAAQAGFPNTTEPPPLDLSSFALENLGAISRREYDPLESLRALTMSVASQPKAATITTPTVTPQPSSVTSGKVILAKGADRAGVKTGQGILDFTRKVAGVFGQPLTITTGTQHNEFVKGTHRESAHWRGNAVDIPASGAKLIRLGRAALVAAGMDPKKAAKANGGVYNIGGVQILFATNVGGNHFGHVHIGLRR